MESTNKPGESVLCKNCQTFYGTHNTNFLCSSCFKQLEPSTQQSPGMSQEKSPLPALSSFPERDSALIFKEEDCQDEIMKDEEEKQEGLVQKAEKLEPIPEQFEEKPKQVPFEPNQLQTNKGICWQCRKKVGLLGFTCKCEYVFCGKHRYAEEHSCDFDYRQRQQTRLAKENPTVKSEKVAKF